MNLQSDIIIYFIKLYTMSLSAYYSFKKIVNIKKSNFKILSIILVVSLILGIICTYIKFYINSYLSVIVLCFGYGSILGIITKNKIAYSIITSIIAYAISLIFLGISIFIEFIPYRLLEIRNNYLNLIIILLIQFVLLYRFFKIKRFKNGFDFLYKRLNNELADIIMINISVIVLLIYCLIGTIYDQITLSLIFAFIILVFTTILIIQKTLTMYYKQKLFEDTLKEYKNEIAEKENELKKLKSEKFNISKITHEFYNRQKALELLVKENINSNEIEAEENVLERIKNLTEEYSYECKKIKTLSKLEKTEIPEIDDMFKYMQSECEKNNIEFKLKIVGNIHPLVNNIIPKNKLETLIGDHLRDAINAVKSAESDKREILAILGIRENNYELCIYDTGIEFEIETLLKLGLQAVTTYSGRGGSGIGFLTTFETMNQTGASLIINEQQPREQRYYTKSVTIRFDNKNEYKICSYRAYEIMEYNYDNNRIIVEKI